MVYVGPKSPHVRCANGDAHQACNWTVPASEAGQLCPACRLTRVIPNLNEPDSLTLWRVMEQAKRHVIYSLMRLELPINDRLQDKEKGLAFEFLRPAANSPVTTGHEKGMIVLNLNEAFA
jgi:hypothetical protein